jgi:hypothetical protein
MPYVDDATEAAFIAADKESEKEIERFCKEQGISPASMAFAFGFRAGFRTAHPTWQAILAKRKAFAESPEGRARRAWIDMVIAANKLIAKGRAPPLDEGEEDENENENENVENENEGGPPPVKVPPNSRDKDKPEAVHVATAAEILRAGAVRRGEVTGLPVDPVARDHPPGRSAQGRKGPDTMNLPRFRDPFKDLRPAAPPPAAPGAIDAKALAAQIVLAGKRRRGELACAMPEQPAPPGGRRPGCARQSHPRRSEKGEKCHVRIVSRLSNSRRSVARPSLCRVPLHALSGARSIMARHE